MIEKFAHPPSSISGLLQPAFTFRTTARADPKLELVMLGPGLCGQRVSTAE